MFLVATRHGHGNMPSMEKGSPTTSSQGPAPGPSPDAKAAHEFLVELTTRIATRRLPYRDGDEQTALESLRKLFELGRGIVAKHHGCHRAAFTIGHILNDLVAPVTAEWHCKSIAGLLKSRDGGDTFREQLRGLQDALRSEAEQLANLTGEGDGALRFRLDWDDGKGPGEAQGTAIPGEPLSCGLPDDAWKVSGPTGATAEPMHINLAEWDAIRLRRCALGLETASDPRHDVFGLALSGGGIRSAAFSLGVVQVLAERGLLREVDYLSTVSGGGYTGSFITRQLGSGPAAAAAAPSSQPPSCGAHDAMLAKPNGPDTGPIRYLRLRARYLSGDDFRGRCLMACHVVAGTMLNWMAPLLVLVLLALLLALISSVASGSPRPWEAIRRDVARGVAWGVGVLGLAGMGAYGIWMRFSKQPVNEALKRVAFAWVLLLLVWLGIETDAWAGQWIADVKSWWQAGRQGFGMGLIAVLAAAVAWVLSGAWGGAPGRRIRGAVALGLAALLLPVAGLLCEHALLEWAAQDPKTAFWVLAGSALALGLGACFALDVNRTSPRPLYQERLARTFIQRADEDSLDLPLPDTNGTHLAPIHILNATLNIPTSKQAPLRERGCDFFSFTRFHAGAPSVGYAPTRQWTSRGQPMSLATAMAVSAAAASSRMGLGSMPALAPLLAMLNIRLGYWIKKPWEHTCTDVPGAMLLLREMLGLGMDEKARWLNLSDGGHIENMGAYELLRRRCRFIVCVDGEADPGFGFGGIMTLVRHARIDLGVEMLPQLDEIRPDPSNGFSRSHFALWTIRYPMRPGEAEDGLGFLLYLKLSVTGNEPELIRTYREAHPAFPHEPTSDQFFGEHQFEAYRSLGVHVAEMLFKDALMRLPAHAKLLRPTTVQGVRDWFTRLVSNLQPPMPHVSP
jgi:hypothetical protein